MYQLWVTRALLCVYACTVVVSTLAIGLVEHVTNPLIYVYPNIFTDLLDYIELPGVNSGNSTGSHITQT